MSPVTQWVSHASPPPSQGPERHGHRGEASITLISPPPGRLVPALCLPQASTQQEQLSLCLIKEKDTCYLPRWMWVPCKQSEQGDGSLTPPLPPGARHPTGQQVSDALLPLPHHFPCQAEDTGGGGRSPEARHRALGHRVTNRGGLPCSPEAMAYFLHGRPQLYPEHREGEQAQDQQTARGRGGGVESRQPWQARVANGAI